MFKANKWLIFFCFKKLDGLIIHTSTALSVVNFHTVGMKLQNCSPHVCEVACWNSQARSEVCITNWIKSNNDKIYSRKSLSQYLQSSQTVFHIFIITGSLTMPEVFIIPLVWIIDANFSCIIFGANLCKVCACLLCASVYPVHHHHYSS